MKRFFTLILIATVLNGCGKSRNQLMSEMLEQRKKCADSLMFHTNLLNDLSLRFTSLQFTNGLSKFSFGVPRKNEYSDAVFQKRSKEMNDSFSVSEKKVNEYRIVVSKLNFSIDSLGKMK